MYCKLNARGIDSFGQRHNRARDGGLKEHPFVSSIILTGSVLCKVTLAVPTWGLSPEGGTSAFVDVGARRPRARARVASIAHAVGQQTRGRSVWHRRVQGTPATERETLLC